MSALRWLALGLGASVLATGCGSTVAVSHQVGQRSAFDESGLTPSYAPDSLHPSPVRGAAALGPAGRNPSSHTDPARSNQPGATTAPLPAPPHVPGVTATTVEVGLNYVTNGDAFTAGLGAGSVTSGDQRAEFQAIVDDINRHGGVAGRRLVPVWHAEDATSTESADTLEQAKCAAFTQDRHVFAVVDTGRASYIKCITRTAIMLGGATPGLYQETDFSDYPYYLDPDTVAVDRQGRALVPLLVQQRYFSSWDTAKGAPGTLPAHVGILAADLPAWNHEIDAVVLPLLARAGIRVDPRDIYRIFVGSSSSDSAQSVQQVQSAALRMGTTGVTHVIDLDSSGQLTLLFANDAYSQRYFPRLGITSGAALQAIVTALQKPSKNGAMGLGFMPVLDLPSGEGTRPAYTSSSQTRCAKVMADAGIQFTSTNAQIVAFGACDQLYTLQRVAGTVSALSRQGVLAAIDTSRRTFPGAAVPELVLGPDRHDGISQGWDMRYDSGCDCVRYVGKAFTIS